MDNVIDEEEEKGDSKNPYDPMAGRLTPYLAEGGIVDDEQTKAPPPPPMPIAPPRPMPGMGADVNPNALQQMLGRYKSGMEQYGPEQQMAMRASLTKANQGFLPSLARAGGGFADAIMQGVARAGPSNFQQSITNQQNKTMDDTMATLESARTGKMAQIQAEMKMSMDDPDSPMSKIARNAQRPTLLKLGWTDDQINKVSGNTAEDAAKSGLTYYESKTKADLASEIHGQNIEMQKQQLEAMKARQKAETVQGAAGKLQSRTGLQKLRDVISLSPETKALQGQLSPNGATAFETEQEAEASGLPKGTVITIAGRRARIK